MENRQLVRIKICGITNPLDYELVQKLQADYAGFIFYPESPRYVEPKRAKEIIQVHRPKSCRNVGVFVNEPLEKVKRIAEATGIDIVQLHGDEDSQYCDRLGLPYWKVVRVSGEIRDDQLSGFNPAAFLLDSGNHFVFGGSGRQFNWSWAQKLILSGKKVIIAGGVSCFNIPDLLEIHPYGIDVCSSVEAAPGKKSEIKTKKLFQVFNHLNKGGTYGKHNKQ